MVDQIIIEQSGPQHRVLFSSKEGTTDHASQAQEKTRKAACDIILGFSEDENNLQCLMTLKCGSKLCKT